METRKENPIVLVEKIYDPRDGKNPDYMTLQLRSESIRQRTSGVVSRLLGGNFKEKRVAFMSIHKDVVSELNLKEGDNLSEKMEMDLRLTVREISESQYNKLPESGDANGFNKPAFSEKLTPSKDQLYHNGEKIYRCIKLTSIDVEDVYLANDPVSSSSRVSEKMPESTEFNQPAKQK